VDTEEAEPLVRQQCLYFLPLPQGQGSFLPVFWIEWERIVDRLSRRGIALNWMERPTHPSGARDRLIRLALCGLEPPPHFRLSSCAAGEARPTGRGE
jgi:hypothetical protein